MADATLSTADEARLPAIDEAALTRITFGDGELARELLALFVEQAAMLMARIAEAQTGPGQREVAHRLCGSARVIAACRVDAAATSIEERLVAGLARGENGPLPAHDADLLALARAVGETCRAIALREAGASA